MRVAEAIRQAQAAVREQEAAIRASGKRLGGRFGAEVVRETEKAILVRMTFRLNDGEPRPMEWWLPTSQARVVEGFVEAPEWLIQQKLQEARTRFGRTSQVYFSYELIGV